MQTAKDQYSPCGTLREEYFPQNERDKSTLPRARADWHQAAGQSFTLHGHRLSSLFRISHQTASGLIKGESDQTSFCRKYSTPQTVPGAPAKGTR